MRIATPKEIQDHLESPQNWAALMRACDGLTDERFNDHKFRLRASAHIVGLIAPVTHNRDVDVLRKKILLSSREKMKDSGEWNVVLQKFFDRGGTRKEAEEFIGGMHKMFHRFRGIFASMTSASTDPKESRLRHHALSNLFSYHTVATEHGIRALLYKQA